MTNLKLHTEWAARSRLCAEGSKLWDESDRLRDESDRLRDESSKLWSEGDRLFVEGDKIFVEAVIAEYGNVKMSWTWRTSHSECTLENGDVYGGTL